MNDRRGPVGFALVWRPGDAVLVKSLDLIHCGRTSAVIKKRLLSNKKKNAKAFILYMESPSENDE